MNGKVDCFLNKVKYLECFSLIRLYFRREISLRFQLYFYLKFGFHFVSVIQMQCKSHSIFETRLTNDMSEGCVGEWHRLVINHFFSQVFCHLSAFNKNY